MQTFLDRTKIIKSIRSTARYLGFCEVEGPTLHTIPAGRAARPVRKRTQYARHAIDDADRVGVASQTIDGRGMERRLQIGTRVPQRRFWSPRPQPEFTDDRNYQRTANYEIDDGFDRTKWCANADRQKIQIGWRCTNASFNGQSNRFHAAVPPTCAYADFICGADR